MTDAPPPTLVQKLSAEGLGTFVLVFFGCGAFMASEGNYVATALAFGISVLVMVAAVGHISGGHFNPAVSTGAAMGGRISWMDTAMYIVAQLVGALIAGLVLFGVYSGFDGFDAEGNMAQNGFGDEGSGLAMWAALLVEFIGTAIFLYVILAVTDKRNTNAKYTAPVAIGLSLSGLHFAMIGLTGTSVNPARSIGVGVFAGSDAIIQLWVFIVAPLLGAAVAGFTYALIFGADGPPVPGSGLNFGGPAAAAAPAGAAGGWDPNAWQGQPAGQPGAQPGPPQGQPGQWQGGDPWAQPQPGQPQPGQPGQWQQPPAQDPGQQWGPQGGAHAAPDPNQQWGQPQPGQQDPNQQWGQPQPGQQDPGQQEWPGGDGQSGTQIRRPDGQ